MRNIAGPNVGTLPGAHNVKGSTLRPDDDATADVCGRKLDARRFAPCSENPVDLSAVSGAKSRSGFGNSRVPKSVVCYTWNRPKAEEAERPKYFIISTLLR
jgi:hypothetical protein